MTDDATHPDWDADRIHPLLTKTDWGFLTTEGYFADRARPSVSQSQQRQKIRNRIRNAFRDFALLVGYLDEGDIERIFQDPTADQVNGMTDALSLIYRGTRDGVRVAETGAKESFEPMIRRAIRNGEAALDESATNTLVIDVTFENDEILVKKNVPSESDVERISAKIDAGEIDDLSRGELAWFIEVYKQSGELDTDAAVDAYHRIESLWDTDVDEE